MGELKRASRSARIGLALLAAILGLLGAGCGLLGKQDGDTVSISGNVEVTDAEVAFRIPGRVSERLVDEGDRVRQGQVLARLESRDLEQGISMVKAEIDAAQAQLDELEAGSRPEEVAQAAAAADKAAASLADLLAGARPGEIASAEAAVAAAQAEADRTSADFVRVDGLFARGVLARKDLDAARAAKDMAAARLADARERLGVIREGARKDQVDAARNASKEAMERYRLVKRGPREEVIRSARARLNQAKERLALNQTSLSYATIVSPLDGFVLSKSVEAGEFVSPGTPVVTVGDLTHPWIRAYVGESDLGRIRLGQKVEVRCDGWPGRVFVGKVTFIAQDAEFTPKTVQTKEERTRLVYRVKIAMENPDYALKPGMPVDGSIRTGR